MQILTITCTSLIRARALHHARKSCQRAQIRNALSPLVSSASGELKSLTDGPAQLSGSTVDGLVSQGVPWPRVSIADAALAQNVGHQLWQAVGHKVLRLPCHNGQRQPAALVRSHGPRVEAEQPSRSTLLKVEAVVGSNRSGQSVLCVQP